MQEASNGGAFSLASGLLICGVGDNTKAHIHILDCHSLHPFLKLSPEFPEFTARPPEVRWQQDEYCCVDAIPPEFQSDDRKRLAFVNCRGYRFGILDLQASLAEPSVPRRSSPGDISEVAFGEISPSVFVDSAQEKPISYLTAFTNGFITVDSTDQLRIWDASSGVGSDAIALSGPPRRRSRMTRYETTTVSCAEAVRFYSPGGSSSAGEAEGLFVSRHESSVVWQYDLRTGEVVFEHEDTEGSLHSRGYFAHVTVDPFSRGLYGMTQLVGYGGSRCCVFAPQRRESVQSVSLKAESNACSFAQEKHLLVFGQDRGQIEIRDTRKLENSLHVFRAHQTRNPVLQVKRIEEDVFVSLSESEFALATWNAQTGKILKRRFLDTMSLEKICVVGEREFDLRGLMDELERIAFLVRLLELNEDDREGSVASRIAIVSEGSVLGDSVSVLRLCGGLIIRLPQ